MEDNGKKRKAIAERSYETQILIDLLDGIAIGDVVTFEKMNSATKADIFGKRRYYLKTARDRLRADKGKWFLSIRGVGVRRTDDVGVADELDMRRKRIGGAARLAAKISTCIGDLAGLAPDRRARVLYNQSVFAMTAISARESTQKRIAKALVEKGAEVPLSVRQFALKLQGKDPDDE